MTWVIIFALVLSCNCPHTPVHKKTKTASPFLVIHNIIQNISIFSSIFLGRIIIGSLHFKMIKLRNFFNVL